MSAHCCILSYKMAELTDRTVDNLLNCGWEIGRNLFVYENGSEDESHSDVSQYVTHFTGGNLRMTGGWNYIVKKHRSESIDWLWLCTNDFEITGGVPSPDFFHHRLKNDVGWWHPAVERIQGYAYPWMFYQGIGLRDVRMTDSICPALNINLIWQMIGPQANVPVFDPELYRGWGIDYDTCYQARRRGYRVVIDDNITVKHEASKTYSSGVAPESVEEFYKSAYSEMNKRLTEKYGANWHKRIME